MTGFRVDRPACAVAAALVIALMLAPGPATGADQTSPTRLSPGNFPAQGETPQPQRGAERPEGSSIIKTTPLPAIGGEAAGVLDRDTGGLGTGMWEGSYRARVDSWMPLLPAATTSPAMRSLMRRLLLSVATPPGGGMEASRAPGSKEGSGTGFLGLRAERLFAMGDFDDVEALAQAAGRAADRDPEFTRVRMDARFLQGDADGACDLARDSTARTITPYIHRVSIFCQAISGERQKAELGLALLKDEMDSQKPDEQAADEQFLELYERLLAKMNKKEPVRPVENLARPSPLAFAMLHQTGLSLPSGVITDASLPMLPAIARDEGLDRLVRVHAAERAVAASEMDVAPLRELYRGFGFGDVNPDRLLSLNDDAYGPEFRAQMFQAIAATNDVGKRAQLLGFLLKLARRHGDLRLVARAELPELQRLAPSPDLMWFAGDAARALYDTGHIPEARSWFQFLQANVRPGSAGDEMLTELWPLARLGDPFSPPPADQTRLRAWWDLQRKAYGSQAGDARAALVFAALDALGEPLDMLQWHPLLDGPAATAQATDKGVPWRLLAPASARGRRGETVLAALIALAGTYPSGTPRPDGLGAVNPVILREALAALRNVGLVDEARAVAFDVVMAARM